MTANHRTAQALCLAASASLVLLAAGCSENHLPSINSTAEFQQTLWTNKPMLVFFYKSMCMTCAVVEPTVNRLSDEYAGRVAIYQFERQPSADLRAELDVVFFPTVVLFMNNKECHRWVGEADINAYRKVLNEVLPPPQPVKPAASTAKKPSAKTPKRTQQESVP